MKGFRDGLPGCGGRAAVELRAILPGVFLPEVETEGGGGGFLHSPEGGSPINLERVQGSSNFARPARTT